MIMEYRPKFYTTERDNKLALWVTLPDDTNYNIWDVDKRDFSKDIMESVVHSFMLGMKACNDLHAKAYTGSFLYNTEFVHIDGATEI